MTQLSGLDQIPIPKGASAGAAIRSTVERLYPLISENWD